MLKQALGYYEPDSEPERVNSIIQSWCPTNKAGEFNDFSGCTTWGASGKPCQLLNVFR